MTQVAVVQALSSLRGRGLTEAQPAPCNDTQEREEMSTNPPAKTPDGLDRFNERMFARKAGRQVAAQASPAELKMGMFNLLPCTAQDLIGRSPGLTLLVSGNAA